MLEYLPQQLTELEILDTFRETVVKLGTNSMKHVGKCVCLVAFSIGNVHGKLTFEIVKQYLNK